MLRNTFTQLDRCCKLRILLAGPFVATNGSWSKSACLLRVVRQPSLVLANKRLRCHFGWPLWIKRVHTTRQSLHFLVRCRLYLHLEECRQSCSAETVGFQPPGFHRSLPRSEIARCMLPRWRMTTNILQAGAEVETIDAAGQQLSAVYLLLSSPTPVGL